MPSPKAQGDLDYFCGMYAVVNAYQACGEKSERASEQIFDASSVHVLTEISREVRERAGRRSTYIVAENETPRR